MLLAGASADGGLVHRYSFTGNPNDSIGSAHGTLINNNGNANYSGSSLQMGNSQLPNSNSTSINYVDLPNGIISSLGTAMTLEAWVTWYGPSSSSWQRIFDFGTSDAGENQSSGGNNSTYFFLTPRSGSGTYRFGHRRGVELDGPVEYTIDGTGPLPVDQEVHVAIVWDETSGQVRMILNGQQVASGPLQYTLAQLPDINNWLGRSQWGDPGFHGSYNEFRIYNIALSNEMLLGNYQAGPDVLNDAFLKARDPQPSDEAKGIAGANVTLRWKSEGEPLGHRIRLGQDPQALAILENNYTGTSYVLHDLDFNTTYYWRIDVLYSTKTIEGDIWSFRTMNKPAPCLPGDLDGNCTVDLADLILFSEAWMENVVCSAFDCPDFDRSLFVDMDDLAILAGNWQQSSNPLIVINEIHYHPDENTEPVEFLELYNAGAQAIDLDGWYMDSGVRYTFQGTHIINPGEYVVICQDPDAFEAKFGMSAFGPFDGKLSNDGELLVLRNAAGKKIDEVDYKSRFPWPVAAHGEGASMELINPYLDNDLAGSWRSSGYRNSDRPELAFGAPSPGAPNRTYTEAAPPQIRQVRHAPEQPLSSEAVRISAKITDPDGVQSVTLKYQLVAPGAYIPAYLPLSVSSLVANPYQDQPLNPAFEDPANWLEMPMVDDGSGADETAGDHTYTALIPAQVNRTLVRYRIEAVDNAGNAVRVPYADDPSLNFACYVYDGVPDYTASKDSVNSAGHVHSSDTLTSIPVYSLITRAEDMYMCNGYNESDRFFQDTFDFNYQEAARRYNWEGAFVYEGIVYDHVKYRLRGGNGRYNYGNGGKRSMKFRFNRGHYFQARDIDGNKLPSKWKNLNTGKMFGNHAGYGRYPYGVNEIMNYRLFAQSGVPSPEAWWFHFRVVDGADEAPATTDGQYEGDFYGLHMAFENYDGAFLDRLGLPKGNLYKLSDKVNYGLEQLRYQGPDAVVDASDYENIRWNLTHEASADFIRNHLDCDEWYRYHTVAEAIRHYDVFSGATCWHCLKNMAWYFFPEYTNENNHLGKLWFIPFDVDDTWGPFWNAGVDHAKAAIYDQRYTGSLEQFTIQPEKLPLRQEYRNYMRHFRDLHWQPEVINHMIDELVGVIADFVPADRDRWRLDNTVPGNPLDNGPLEEGIAIMKNFAWNAGSANGFSWPGASNNLDSLANAEDDAANLPHTPAVSYIGSPGYPENDLRFETSDFSDPQGNHTFAAMQWRIAEYALKPLEEPQPQTTLTLVGQNEFWNYFKGTQEPSTPRDLWRQVGFNDEDWYIGQTSIGYSDDDDRTVLLDMQHNYSTLYLRKKFEVQNKDNIQTLKLHVYIDDGCIIWINGTEVARLYCSGGEKYYNSLTNEMHHEAEVYDEVILPAPYDYLVNGDNVIAVHGIQETLGSSDFSVDVSVTADLYVPLPPKPAISDNKYEINPLWESDELTTFDSQIVFPANGVKAGRTYRVRCRMKDTSGRWSHWSAPAEFVAGEALRSDLHNYLRITELMYNNGDAEFIELKNTGPKTLDLSNVAITSGIQFAFAGSHIESLAPGAFVLIIKSQADFEAQYGTGLNSLIAGQFASGSLSNSGETLKLEDTWDGTLIEFTYSDARGWPLAADGAGHSLVPLDAAIEEQPQGTLDYGGNWRASTYLGGSPGMDDPVSNVRVMINEFMAHTDINDPVNYPGYDSNDWIELYNAGNTAVFLDSNWYLSDNSNNLKKWALPGSYLPVGGIISFDEITGFNVPLGSGFALSKAGEEIYLSYLPGTNQDRVVDCIQFKGQENSISEGRFPNGSDYWFAFDPATRNGSNKNAVGRVVISEFMYHPADGQEEYLELYNPTASPVALTEQLPLGGTRGWILDDGIRYEFPAATPPLPAGGRILIVGFDPYDTNLREAFETAYGIGNLTPGVNLFGPWSGNLSNGGERLSLEKPQDSDDPLNPLAVSWVIIDECIYDDFWPWPVEPDGNGPALQRISSAPTASGNDPANWQAGNPTPGY
jgi:hypothetical protein